MGIDKDMVRLDMTARPGPDGQMPEFAADLDIDDPEFEDRVRDARMYAEQAVTPAASESARLPVLLTSELVASDVDSGVVAAMVMGEAVGRVCDLVPIVSMPDCAEPGQAAIVLSAVANRLADGIHLLVKLSHRPSSRTFWSHKFVLDAADLTAAMSNCTAQICVGILRVLEALRTVDAAYCLLDRCVQLQRGTAASGRTGAGRRGGRFQRIPDHGAAGWGTHYAGL